MPNAPCTEIAEELDFAVRKVYCVDGQIEGKM
jgi:hypothetical protein